jgi:hypothetical protein
MSVRRPIASGVSLIACLGLVLSALGCGGGGGHAADHTVKGKVTLGGKPLPGGEVQFYGGSNFKEASPVGLINPADGTYSIPNPPTGNVKVVVRAPTQPSNPKDPKPPEVHLPAKVSDPNQTDLTYTVSQEAQQTHDIDLK